MEPLRVADDLWLCENAVYLPKEKTLVISDLQLGYEQHLRDAGSNILYEQARQMLVLLERLIAQTGATQLVINGDLKHEFGRITRQERTDIVGLLSRLQRRIKIIVVRGNHDTVTQPLTDDLGIPLVESLMLGNVFILHGHELVDVPKTASSVIIGHVHPAVTLHDGVRAERFKCILVGKYKKKRLIVLPSFSTIVEGGDILKGASMHSPYLQGSSSMVYVIADVIRPFGKVSDLRRMLG